MFRSLVGSRRARSGGVVIAAVVALCVALTACGSSSSTKAKSSGTAASSAALDLSGVTLKIATYPAGGDNTLLKAAGLLDTPYKLAFQTYSNGGAITSSVISGTSDLARGSGVANVLVAAGGTTVNFRSVATVRLTTAWQWTVAKPSIKSLADLKGKKVTYTANTTAEYFLLKQLASVGLTFKDIQPVPLDPASGLAALMGGSVDALSNSAPYSRTAVARGFPILADGGSIVRGSLGALDATYNANVDSLKDPAKAAAMADYIARIDASFAWARAHPADWNQAVSTALNAPLAIVTASFKDQENDVNSAAGPVVPASITDEQDIADTFLAAGVFAKKVDAAATFTDQLNSQISAAIAKYKAQRAADYAVTKVA